MFRTCDETELAAAEVSLAELGYAIVPALLDEEGRRGVLTALRELHDQQDYGQNDFVGYRTKRVFNLFAKTRALDPLLVEPSVLRIVRSRLGPEAQLSIASTMEIYEGETPQPLHQDDAYYPQRPHPPLVINTIWALNEFSELNGGTRLVPGSHLSSEPVDPEAVSIAAEMPPGSVLLWDGAVWHGGGPNITTSARFGLSLNYCRGWIRQQENQYLSLDPALVISLPEDVQKLLGYDVCQFVGYADGYTPRSAIKPDNRVRLYAGQGFARRT